MSSFAKESQQIGNSEGSFLNRGCGKSLLELSLISSKEEWSKHKEQKILQHWMNLFAATRKAELQMTKLMTNWLFHSR